MATRSQPKGSRAEDTAASQYPLETNKSRRKQPKRVVNSLSLWLEAWNRVLIAHKPEKALELAQYQTLLCMAFERYPHEACVEYDSCSGDRQARINNYVGTSTRKILSFGVFHQNQQALHRAPMLAHGSLATRSILSRLGPAASDQASHTATGDEICIRFNLPRTRGAGCKISTRVQPEELWRRALC